MKTIKVGGRQVRTEEEKAQMVLQSAYAKKYKLPVKAIGELQRLKVIPLHLVDLKFISESDHYFMSRYSRAWAREEHVLAGLSVKTIGEREILITAVSKLKPEWHQWLNYEYGRTYGQLYVSGVSLPKIKDIQKAVLGRYGVVLSAVQVGDIRKIAKRRYLNGVAGGSGKLEITEIVAENVIEYETEIEGLDPEELEIEADWELEYGEEVYDENE